MNGKRALVVVVILLLEGLHCLLGWRHRDSDFFPQLLLNSLEFLLFRFLDGNILVLCCATWLFVLESYLKQRILSCLSSLTDSVRPLLRKCTPRLKHTHTQADTHFVQNDCF